jgi:hypothetical protein
MNPSTIIHIGTVHMHVPAPGVLLHSDDLAASMGFAAGYVSPAIAPTGTVIDHSTGLMWSKATIAKGKTWAEAKAAAEAVRLGGYTDWRLPTRAELITLVDDTRSNPAIDTTQFDCESDWYWTSTPLASSPSVCAWFVYFYDGSAYYLRQHDLGRVRAVRSMSSPASGQ